MEPRDKLQAVLAIIEAHAKAARTRHQGLQDLASDSQTRLHSALERYRAVLPALGAGGNPALEREYAERLQDHHGMALAPIDPETEEP